MAKPAPISKAKPPPPPEPAPLRADPFADLLSGRARDPFALLGIQDGPADPLYCTETGGRCIRVFRPDALAVSVLIEDGANLSLDQIRPEGLFAADLPDTTTLKPGYRLHLTFSDGASWEEPDAYGFGSTLGEMDRHLFVEGTHQQLYQSLGAHPCTLDGAAGTRFALWAPNAQRVSVVGPFNHWDGRRAPMRPHPGSGLWDIFLPDVGAGSLYKFEILGQDGQLLPLKADPFAFQAEHPPHTASVVHGLPDYGWGDADWVARRGQTVRQDAPLSIYEVHAPSWRRHPDPGGSGSGTPLSWDELSAQLIPYVVEMGFTHIELLPISEYPFDGSWGYQPTGLFAPTSRLGPPERFKAFVDACHQAGIGVLLDWVVGHFPEDAHGLAQFDGTALYEHADPRQGRHEDWGTLIYNYGRTEVVNVLLANALFWIEEFHIDGLRVDAVASMLYLDYSREPGEWVPNHQGGRENLEAVAFLRRLNDTLHALCPGAITIAEESTSWPGVSAPTEHGGLGFDYKWNMGWMNDTLSHISRDPIHRRWHHHELTFGMVYAYSERYILPLSHDEVVHGKRSLLGRMPGDSWQQFAGLRAYLAFLMTHPGKKLLFMGGEFGQGREWAYGQSLDWHLLEIHWHQGLRDLTRDLLQLYRHDPALHSRDCDPAGFAWVDCTDADHSVLAYLRKGADPKDLLLVVCNFTPTPHHGYRIGLPQGGLWRCIFNSDAACYGGSGLGDLALNAEPVPSHGHGWSVLPTIPPLATVILSPDPR